MLGFELPSSSYSSRPSRHQAGSPRQPRHGRLFMDIPWTPFRSRDVRVDMGLYCSCHPANYCGRIRVPSMARTVHLGTDFSSSAGTAGLPTLHSGSLRPYIHSINPDRPPRIVIPPFSSGFQAVRSQDRRTPCRGARDQDEASACPTPNETETLFANT